MFFLIAIGVAVFLFMQMAKGPAEPADGRPSNSDQIDLNPSYSDRAANQPFPSEKSRAMPQKTIGGTNGGWSIDQVDNGKSQSDNEKAFQPSTNPVTRKGDWSIEGVGSKNEATDSGFSLKQDPNPRAPEIKLESNDWTVDGMEKKSTPKKTTSGNWSVEEVDK